ncbi:MAG: hypothetical protein ACQSGP_28870 [Frankia sp.]
MPPVSLTAVCAAAPLTDTDPEPLTVARGSTHRGHLRLVSSSSLPVASPEAEVHGRGGPDSCTCRECTMARHPAFGPKLTLV